MDYKRLIEIHMWNVINKYFYFVDFVLFVARLVLVSLNLQPWSLFHWDIQSLQPARASWEEERERQRPHLISESLVHILVVFTFLLFIADNSNSKVHLLTPFFTSFIFYLPETWENLGILQGKIKRTILHLSNFSSCRKSETLAEIAPFIVTVRTAN